MSKSNNRKGNSARGRTADSCKGVTLSAEGEHKGGGSTKVESRSGSVKPAERGATVGSAQARKSEENIPSGSGGTAPNGYSRVPSKTRNENAPMRDSSNTSTPLPTRSGLAKGRYTNRFGVVRAIEIVDLTQACTLDAHAELYRSSSDIHLQTADLRTADHAVAPAEFTLAPDTEPGNRMQAKVLRSEVKVTPAHALKTQMLNKTVCREFLVGRCEYDTRCRRIHPSKEDVASLRAAAARSRPKINEICQKFSMDGRCFWGVLCDRIHQLPDRAPPSNPESELDVVNFRAGCRLNHQSQISTPLREPGVIAASVLEPHPACSTNEALPNSGDISNHLASSNRDADHVPETQMVRTSKSIPKAEVCRDFSKNRCLKGDRCPRTHLPHGNTAPSLICAPSTTRPVGPVALAIAPESSASPPREEPREIITPDVVGHKLQSRSSDGPGDAPQTEIDIVPPSQPHPNGSVVPEITRDVCRLFLRGRCHRGKRCKFMHSRGNTETKTSNAAVSSVSPRTPEDVNGSQPFKAAVGRISEEIHDSSEQSRAKEREICKRYLQGRPHNKKYCPYLHPVQDQTTQLSPNDQSDTSEALDPEPRLGALVDGRSKIDTASVSMPAPNLLLTKTGSRKKKKDILETSATNTNSLGVAHSGGQPPAVSISAAASAAVVKLPSPRRSRSVSTEPNGHHDSPPGQKVCNDEGSFSTESQTSESSINVFSDSSMGTSTSGSLYSQSTSRAVAELPSDLCLDWLQGRCLQVRCKYLHVDHPSDDRLHIKQSPHEPPGLPSKMAPPSVPDKTVLRHRIDCFHCTLGLCNGVHAPEPIPTASQISVAPNGKSNGIQKLKPELSQQGQKRHALPPTVSPLACLAPVRQLPPSITVTVLEHTKVQLGAGFAIQEITTGFESRWVVLGNVQSNVTEKTIRRVLKPFGQVDDLRVPAASTTTMTVKALFSTSTQAMQAVGALNGALLFGRRVSARLPVNNTSRGNGTLQDSSVQIQWDVPEKLGYAGYANQAEAEAAVLAANGFALHESCIGAFIYEGLPTLGAVNVRFVGLSPSTDAEDLSQFGQPEAVMLERPNYSSLPYAVKGVQGLLDDFGQMLDFEVFPAPYKDGMVRALAHFSSPSVAKTASHHLNGRRPYFIGKGRLIARHVQALSYTLPFDAYDKLASDIAWLRRSFWARGRGAALSVVDRRAERLQDPSLPVFVKLSAEDVGELGHLKSEFEKLLHGEKVVHDGKVVWDGFFERPIGSAFLYELERNNPGVSIQKSIGRRTITLFGPMGKRQYIRRAILDKIARIRAQQIRIIPLAGRLIGLFMSVELMDLQKDLGHENVVLNLLRRTLTIRGNDMAYDAVQRAVRDVQKRQTGGKRDDIVECPVCFNQVISPIKLQCGHSWCRSCFANYLVAAIDNKIFPLTCLGQEATCSQPVSVAVARDVLTADDFDRVINASFFAYVYSRPDEFHYCPTPDCPQIYRSAPPDTILQCPSCLARICPSCHTEAHDGMSCANRDIEGEKLFKEWMETHDVKSCPGCKASIEKVAGCNHMTCTQCQTHICWVCLETFPKAEGIYDHMRAAHGGIGLRDS